MAPPKEREDPLLSFAESLRSKGGVENRSAVLGGERYELFRGKDLGRWVKAHADKVPPAAAGKAAEGGPEELARHLGTQLLHRRLALRVDRLSKKPLPGSKKLVKFPRKLAQLPPEQAMTFAEDGFYIWLYERPASPWAWIWTALIPLGVVGACLFPLAPNWAKVAVFYVSSGLLFLILGVLLIRAVLALVTWVATGNTVWLLPNLSSEDVPITQLHKPFISVERPAADAPRKWANHPLTRLAVGAAVAGLLYVLYSHAPDKASITTEATRYRDEVMDWLGLQREGQQRLGNGTAAGNATVADAGDSAAGGGPDAGGAGDAAAGSAAEAAGDGAADPDAAEL
ncbi:hypothetical protein ABPG77_001739 [Micractinium sp. CCAP 211/92]